MVSDALFFGAHPDDIELTSGGLAALLARHGHVVTLVDLTRGEAGSRGDAATRKKEGEAAAAALGVAGRIGLGLPDTRLDARDPVQLAAVAGCLRAARPRLVVAPDREDPHPDHTEACDLVTRACYLAGLARYDAPGERYRPRRLLYALHRTGRRPHLVVDIGGVWERRVAAIASHASQLAGSGTGPATYLTSPDFLPEIEGRARHYGALIGVRFGEGYRTRGPLAVADARALLDAPAGGGPA